MIENITLVLFNKSEALLCASDLFDEISTQALKFNSMFIYEAEKDGQHFLLMSKNPFQSQSDASEFYDIIKNTRINKVIIVSEYNFIDSSFLGLFETLSQKAKNENKNICFNSCQIDSYHNASIQRKLNKEIRKEASRDITAITNYLEKQIKTKKKLSLISKRLHLKPDVSNEDKIYGMFYLLGLINKKSSTNYKVFNFLEILNENSFDLEHDFKLIYPLLTSLYKKGAISFPFGVKKVHLFKSRKLNEEERILYSKIKDSSIKHFEFNTGENKYYSPLELALAFSKEKPHLNSFFWEIINICHENGFVSLKKIQNTISATTKGKHFIKSLEKRNLNDFYVNYC